MTARGLDHYLDRHAEPLARAASLPRLRDYRWGIVVPAFDEPADFLERLLPASITDALIIVVVNAPHTASPAAQRRTAALLHQGDERLSDDRPRSALQHREFRRGIDVLYVDAVTAPLPARRSTGLARKLGCDLLCRLLNDGIVDERVLLNTDADAVLPADYCATALRELHTDTGTDTTNIGAVVLPFTHVGESAELDAAGQLYELYVRDVQRRLFACGCPYAYPALGSVLAVAPAAYAMVRGFPQRNAGEDFHLLNKLAKVAPVRYASGTPVVLAARASTRVPFGTGPALARLLERFQTVGIDAAGAEYTSYAPASFELLRQFYAGCADLDPDRDAPIAWRDPDLKFVLKQLGMPRAFDRLRATQKSAQGLQRAVLEWFDALKVVRFLNSARHFAPDTPLVARIQAQLQDEMQEDASELLHSHLTDAGDGDETAPLAVRELTPRELNAAMERTREASIHGVSNTSKRNAGNL